MKWQIRTVDLILQRRFRRDKFRRAAYSDEIECSLREWVSKTNELMFEIAGAKDVLDGISHIVAIYKSKKMVE